MTHDRLMLFTIVMAMASLAAQSPRLHTGDDVIGVGPNVQVSASMPQTMHAEGMIAADPADARRLIPRGGRSLVEDTSSPAGMPSSSPTAGG